MMKNISPQFWNDGFNTEHFNAASDNGKYKDKAKFWHEILVWSAISSAGVSQPIVRRVRRAVTAVLFTQRCLS